MTEWPSKYICMCYIWCSCNKVKKKKENVKQIAREKHVCCTVLYKYHVYITCLKRVICWHLHQYFVLWNTTLLSAISIGNNGIIKWKDNVKNKFIFINRHSTWCNDNEEAAILLLYDSLVKSIWLLHNSLAYSLMNKSL